LRCRTKKTYLHANSFKNINIPTLNLSQDDLIKYAIPKYTSGEIEEQTGVR